MAEISNVTLLEKLQAQFGNDILSHEEPYGLLTLTVRQESIIAIMNWLKDHPELQVNFMTDLCGIHYPFNKGTELGVVYHLHSLVHNLRVRLKVFFSKDNPITPSATSVYSAANWLERETYDFFGIRFEGHPDLRRILNVDEMTYFPMLKQYPLEDQTREDKDDKYFGR